MTVARMQVSYLYQQLFYNNLPMTDLSGLKANTTQKDRLSLASYKTLKVFRNGDFLAKNEFEDIFLLSNANKTRCDVWYEIEESNILQAVQTIEEHSETYEVFPFETKMIWAEELIVKNKSEIYCVTLLNSAIKHVIRPLTDSSIANAERYLGVENICVKDSSVFLFLKNKGNSKGMLKTQNFRQNKRFYKVNQAKNGNESIIIKKFGEILWSIFFKKQDQTPQPKRQTFREILTAMRKGQLGLQQLQNIMNDKRAIKKFMSSRKNSSVRTPRRRILYDPNQENQRDKETIESIYERLGNIPINMGRPFHGMLFSTDKKYKAQTISTDPKQRRIDKALIFSSIQSDVPPSFTKGRKFKKMSIFCESRGKNRRFSQSSRYDNQNDTSLNKSPSKRYEDPNNNFSFANRQSTPSKLYNPLISSLNKKRKSIRIREIFDEYVNKQTMYASKLQKFNEKSKEKAKRLIKQSLTLQNTDTQQKIDDEKFRSALKQKQNQFEKSMASYYVKAQELYMHSKRKQPISSTGNTNKFSQWERVSENSMIAVRHQPLEVQRNEIKIQNQDLYIDKNNKNNEISLNQELFESRYVASQEGNKSGTKDGLLKNEKNQGKNIKAEEHFTENPRRQTQKLKMSAISNPKTKTENAANQSQISSNKNDDFQINLPQNSKMVTKKTAQRSQSDVQLPSFGQYKSKLMPNAKNQSQSIAELKQIRQQIPNNKFKNPVQQIKKKIEEEPKPVQKKETKQQIKITSDMPLKALSNPKESFFQKVQQNLFNQAPSPQQYVYTSKIAQPKVTEIQQQKQVPLSKPPIKKEKPKIKGSGANYGDLNDEIQQISLGTKQQKPLIKQQQKKPASQQAPHQMRPPTPKAEPQQEKQKPIKKTQQKQDSVKGRQKTVQSNASSNGQRSVKKLIDQYIFMINKMGEAVAKTAKLSKKLQKIEWYVGVYFLYKRFYFQRKKIQKYLQDGVPKLTRYEEFSPQQWNQWLGKSDREVLLTKCKQDNVNIQNSLRKMVKKVEIKQLPSRVLLNANVGKDNMESTKIAIEYVVDEYDQAVQLNLLSDPEIQAHICEMVNALYVMAELDGKVAEKKKITEFTRLSRTKEELDHMVQVIFDLYQQQ